METFWFIKPFNLILTPMRKYLLTCCSIFLFQLFLANTTMAIPTGVCIEHYYLDDYYMALYEDQPVDSITVTAPDNSSYTSSSTRVQIGNRPNVGDIFTFDISYSDGSNSVYQYTVDGINDNFAFMTSPGAGEFIDSTTPSIEWQEATNMEKYA